MKFRLLTLIAILLVFMLTPSTFLSKEPEKVTLRSEPATLMKSDVLHTIKNKGLNCPGEKIKGKFKPKYESQTLEGTKVVVDHSTDLMWQQSEDPSQMSWKEVEAYVKKLNEDKYAGFSDWRLPTAEELSSLLTSKKKGAYYIDQVFQKELLSTWSIDIVKDAFAGAWFVDFMEGKPGEGNRAAGLGHVRLVRSVVQEK